MVQNLENQNTQNALPFKGKITTVIFYEPETGFAIFKIRQEGETKSSTAKGYVPNPVAGAKIFYNGLGKKTRNSAGIISQSATRKSTMRAVVKTPSKNFCPATSYRV